MSQLSQRIIAALLCLLVSGGVVAQQKNAPAPSPDHCSSSRAMQELYKKHPASLQAARKQEAYISSIVAKMREQRRTLATQPVQYTIPVVFHVNDPVNPYKVTMEQIRSAMDILNQDYNLANADYSQIDPRFIGLAANLHITFRLADIDPQGNPTTGVTYHYNDLDGRSPDGSGAAVKSVSYWPSEKYLNIWIVSEVEQKGVYNNSGWTYLPDDWVAANHLDGVVYNWRYLGAPGVGCSENGYPYMKRVLTHEVGHFLNLEHTFENGCNAPGDGVDDTPPTLSNYGGCNLTANSCGSVANVENYMDYSSCTKMFTVGQSDRMLAALTSTVAHRNNLWSAANLAATLLQDSVKRLVPGFTLFNESDANNGALAMADTLKLLGGATFSFSNGNLVQGTHFTVQQLPAGLTPVIQVVNNTTAVLSFTGNAAQHNAVNSTDSIKVTFLNAAIQGGIGALYRPYINLGIHFIDPYKIVYNDIPDIVINSANIWTYFSFNVGDGDFGGWLNSGKLRLETYQKAAVCEGSSRNISPLPVNTLIGDTSNFVAGGAYPDEHDIYSNTYTKWAGKTAYIGVKFTLNGKPRYGWIRIAVAADGSSYVIKDYAWNQAPNGSIAAGNAGAPTLSWSRSQFRETLANNGAFSDTAEIGILGNTFAIGSGIFTRNTHYTVSNLPAGLNVELKALNNTTARLAFTGSAASNAASNSGVVTINILPAAFSNQQPADSSQKQLSLSFRDPYTIKYVDVNDTVYTINATNNWYYFLVDNIPEAAYGLWSDSGKLRLETYQQPMVCDGATKNISLLALNTVISDTSHFVAGGAYPDEHNLVTTTYSTWKGKTGYAGFTFTAGGEHFYGWFRFKVAANGSSYTLMDYAYNTMPGGSIKAGQSAPATADTSVHVQDYCTASTALNYNTITRVRLANLDNSSQWDGYKDFTAQSATVTAGGSYQLQINLAVEYWPDISVAAWVDWNGDKQLNDTTEKIFVKRGSGPFTQTITVPANAKTGATLLRVRMGYGSNVKPCGVDSYQGEVEDYTIKVTGGTMLAKKQDANVNTNRLNATSPFTDKINITYQSPVAGMVLVRMYDMNGYIQKEQQHQVVKGNNYLQLDNLSLLGSGIYIIDISNGTSHRTTKVVK
ncbi:T9SS type A sorting domain-containing protein [Chitinophaga polysaccharea]|uniref:M43 family zinc metalloprotease n=1 Tax=Chitinophaga polysaccharea TaxID=1293035 RepID=UPI0014551047|nr:M43 family zinc metalloprotease [Chitinophaga polysaccharea]NLR60316.1 T9SS type A sorting domain-containing protein [Chitinophaga polysaccharea]